MRPLHLLFIAAIFGAILILSAAMVLTSPVLTAAAMHAAPPGNGAGWP